MNANAPVDETANRELEDTDPAVGEVADITDLHHLVAIITRWRLLIASGTLFVVGTTVALLFLTIPAYSATSVLLVDQPLGIANGSEGLNVAQKLSNLMPTYAELATTDFTLGAVKDRLKIKDPISALRSRVSATNTDGTLLLRVTARDTDARVADDLASAVGQALKDGIGVLQEEGNVPPAFRFSVTEVTAPSADRPSRNEVRTVLLAAAFGLAVMAGLAIALEVVFERR